MAVYGPSGQEELYHWKYKYKKKSMVSGVTITMK